MDPKQYQDTPNIEPNLSQQSQPWAPVTAGLVQTADNTSIEQPVGYQTKKVSVWKVLFWVFGVATVLPLIAGLLFWLMLIGMAEGGASGTEFLFLIFVLPLMLFQFISLPGLLVTLVLYLVKVKPQGKRRIVTISALGAVLIYFAWNITGVAIPFLSL